MTCCSFKVVSGTEACGRKYTQASGIQKCVGNHETLAPIYFFLQPREGVNYFHLFSFCRLHKKIENLHWAKTGFIAQTIIFGKIIEILHQPKFTLPLVVFVVAYNICTIWQIIIGGKLTICNGTPFLQNYSGKQFWQIGLCQSWFCTAHFWQNYDRKPLLCHCFCCITIFGRKPTMDQY